MHVPSRPTQKENPPLPGHPPFTQAGILQVFVLKTTDERLTRLSRAAILMYSDGQ
jgi:hypothetical protein